MKRAARVRGDATATGVAYGDDGALVVCLWRLLGLSATHAAYVWESVLMRQGYGVPCRFEITPAEESTRCGAGATVAVDRARMFPERHGSLLAPAKDQCTTTRSRSLHEEVPKELNVQSSAGSRGKGEVALRLDRKHQQW